MTLSEKRPDTPQLLRADHAFVEGLQARLAKSALADKQRVWVSREEVRNLRRIAGLNASNQWLDRLKNRRLRVAHAHQLIERAMQALEVRAVMLHAETFAPPKPRPMPMEDVHARWSKAVHAQVMAQSKLSKVLLGRSTTP